MKKLIASMIVLSIIGQPILASPLSMAQWRSTGDPNLLGDTVQSSWDHDGLRWTAKGHKYVDGPVMIKEDRTMVWIGTGGALAFGLLSWLQFDRASDNEAEAALNREHGQESRAQKLDDKADRARLYGWSAAVLAVGSFGVALISRKTTLPVFPEFSFHDGEPHIGASYAYSF